MKQTPLIKPPSTLLPSDVGVLKTTSSGSLIALTPIMTKTSLTTLKTTSKKRLSQPSLTSLILNQDAPSSQTKKFLSLIKMVKQPLTFKTITPATIPFKTYLITTSMSVTKSSQNAGLKKTTTVLQTALKQVILNFINF